MSEEQQHLPPAAAEAPFRGPPLAVGSVQGIRAFKIYNRVRDLHADSHPMTLHSLHKPYVWLPQLTEHLARCARARYYEMPGTPGHSIASKACTCGFYAYYKDAWSDDVFVAGQYEIRYPVHRVRGIIEGYGLTTLGTEGFRSAKAKIKALIVPAWTENQHRALTGLYTAPDPVAFQNTYNVPVYPSVAEAIKDFPLGVKTP